MDVEKIDKTVALIKKEFSRDEIEWIVEFLKEEG